MQKINTAWKTASQRLASIENFMSVLTYQQFPPQREANAFGFDPQANLQDHLVVLIISQYWSQPGADAYNKVNTFTKDFISRIEGFTKAKKVYHPYKYVNYAGLWQNPYGGLSSEAYASLKATSKKYDPIGVFQKQAVGFKL
jgi:hypothetical protein